MAAPDASSSSSPLIWHGVLTDRSRRAAQKRCERLRYLSTNLQGYGITRQASGLPLATGASVHDGVQRMAEIMLAEDRLPDGAEMRQLVTDTQADYLATVTDRGFMGILKGPHTDETILEQKVLISGLLWVFRLNFLPGFQAEWQLLDCEREHLKILTCDCGAGVAAPAATHSANACSGLALMQRLDLVARRRTGFSLGYFEVKTTGSYKDTWSQRWETDPQLGLGTIDAVARYGGEITELYIVGLHKGARKKDRYNEGEEGRRKQETPLCYAYRRPSNPPLMTDDWQPTYNYVDEMGKNRRVTKLHKRTGIWELAHSDWPNVQAYLHDDPEMPVEEFWVRTLPQEALDDVCFLIGPMNRQDWQIASYLRSAVADEARWSAALWELYEWETAHDQHWGDEAFHAKLDELFPCSWNCRPFGRDMECEMVRLCHRHDGWQQPLALAGYKLRRPHHVPETDQAIARGLLLDETLAAPEEEEERE